ncbi:MAG: formylglycine-generating enzyme family protein [Myxococcales bacterium]|nr:formylglycine-generating enzyme family protein [Myxococcales bacterium]
MCDGDGVRCSAVASTPLATSDATCDLVDDDCDGALDEDPPCNGTACSALGGVPAGYVCIPPGTFRMGSPADEPDRDADEQQHAVTLTRPIIMARTELTQDQWLALPGWQNPALAADAGDRPVERVNVFDAMRWLNARSEHDGLLPCYGLVDCDGFADGGCPLDVEGYAQSSCHGDACADVTFFEGCDGWRLPTEAEWEHAIRAGTTTAYWCGADAGCVDDAEWHGGNVPWGPGASIVATRAANPWGLHDMGGNVQEWVFDHYHEAYGSTPATDPVYRGAAVAGFTGAVIRGTAFGFPFYWARSAQRAPEYETWRDYYIGFRPVRTLRP